MTGEELFKKLGAMTPEERKRKIVVEDYTGVTAQFLTIGQVELKNGEPVEEPEIIPERKEVLGHDYISLEAKVLSDKY